MSDLPRDVAAKRDGDSGIVAGVRHQAISASAGSGKTFRLAHRYLRLLSGGVPPERICALTFSRKAAGEIFDSIVDYLSRAATDDAGAAEASVNIGQSLSCREYRQLLRLFLLRLNRLAIGTLDSFLVGVVRAFPLELGVSPGFDLMDSDGAEGRAVRQEIFAGLFDPAVVRPEAQREFLESFKQATFGTAEKSLIRSIDDFVRKMLPVYRLFPKGEEWGSEKSIWQHGLVWQKLSNTADIADKLCDDLDSADIPPRMRDALSEIITFLGSYSDSSAWDSAIEKKSLFSALMAIGEGSGDCEISYSRQKWNCPAGVAERLRQLVSHVMAVELGRALTQTRGIYDLLSKFDVAYAAHSRHAGALSFDDIALLLSDGSEDVGLRMSRMQDTDNRLFIDYRLDATLDHWLLDEFQDTSDQQWHALSNLADEVLQDDSGRRSFFYVGDVKQAIYGWRGGNHRLFNSILEEYGDVIEQVPMNRSFRSGGAVINAVNRVFSDLPDEIPDGAQAEWGRIWQEHVWAEEVVPSCSFSGLLEVLPAEGKRKSSSSDQFHCIAQAIREIRPLERGLSVAVLTRKNSDGRDCVDLLRSECPELSIVHEGSASILDSPVVNLFLSLVRFAAHPGDSSAWRHLQMSPMADAVNSSGRSGTAVAALRDIQEMGFQQTLVKWADKLSVSLDAFGKQRLGDLLAAAAAFDSRGTCDISSFIQHVEGYTVHADSQASAVRVMTIHQSKGLGFDLVFVPFSNTSASFNAPELPNMLSDSDRKWVLKKPRKIIAEHDATLEDVQKKHREEIAFSQLCVLYVALTRAKQALYMVVHKPPKKGVAFREDSLLNMQLGGVTGESLYGADLIYSNGDIEWFAERPEVCEDLESGINKFPVESSPVSFSACGKTRMKRIEPSLHEGFTCMASAVFEKTAGDVLHFGSAIHRLFEAVEWIDSCDVDASVSNWRRLSDEPEDVLRDAEVQFRACISSEAVREALAKPVGVTVELWREKPFELVMDGDIVSGQFDRVLILRDEQGKAVSATITDFKSNRVEAEKEINKVAERYVGQMAMYRTALASITGLSVQKISAALLFTRAARVVELI